MPVILRPSEWRDWLDGPPDAAGLLCRPYPDLIVVNRTADRWAAPRKAEAVSTDGPTLL
jgi:putative SOS response-associated peptidase YedK